MNDPAICFYPFDLGVFSRNGSVVVGKRVLLPGGFFVFLFCMQDVFLLFVHPVFMAHMFYFSAAGLDGKIE